VTGGAVVAKHELSKRTEETKPVPAIAPVVVPVEAKPTAIEPIPTTLPEVQRPEERPKSSAVPSKAQAPDIREEIRMLDQARSAVKGGESSEALRLLSKYEQRFPHGQFRQEVQVLRMEALKQSGESERAAALAKKFLAEHPKSPHVERVENVGQK
jgi:TolA-binding protein